VIFCYFYEVPFDVLTPSLKNLVQFLAQLHQINKTQHKLFKPSKYLPSLSKKPKTFYQLNAVLDPTSLPLFSIIPKCDQFYGRNGHLANDETLEQVVNETLIGWFRAIAKNKQQQNKLVKHDSTFN
jgi:hypothetical protein